MSRFFPRYTVVLAAHERSALEHVARSTAGMAVITGIVVHGYRWFVLALGQSTNVIFILITIGVGLVLLLGFTTAHLGNHTVRQWLWRAPLFALLEGITEAAMAALFIALGIERVGTKLAQWSDWLSLAVGILLRRLEIILVFTVVLALVVQWVRFALLKREHRDSTALAIHEDHLKHES